MNNKIITESHHNKLKIVLLTLAALLLNVLFSYTASKLNLIIFLDSVFSVALTFYAGLIPGLIVAFALNPIMTVIFCAEIGIPFLYYDNLYNICGMLIILITWLISRNKADFRYSPLFTVLYLLLIAFTSAIASCFCASLLDTFIRPLFGQPSGFGITDTFSSSFQNLNLGSFLSYLLPRIPITVLDRLVCTFAGFGVYYLFEKKTAPRK